MAGASDYYLGGVVSYSNDVKVGILGVSPDTLRLHGAVSEQTACEMAEGVRRLLRCGLRPLNHRGGGPHGRHPGEARRHGMDRACHTARNPGLQIGLRPPADTEHRTRSGRGRQHAPAGTAAPTADRVTPKNTLPRMAAFRAAMRLPGSEPQHPLRRGNPLCCPHRTDRPTRPNAFRRPAPRPEIIIFRYFKPRCDGLNLQCSNQISLKT